MRNKYLLNKYIGGGFEAGQNLADVAKRLGSVKVEVGPDGKQKIVPNVTRVIKTTEAPFKSSFKNQLIQRLKKSKANCKTAIPGNPAS